MILGLTFSCLWLLLGARLLDDPKRQPKDPKQNVLKQIAKENSLRARRGRYRRPMTEERLQTIGAVAVRVALAGESVSYGRVHSGGRRRVSKEQEIREA